MSMDPMRKFEHAIKGRDMICAVLDQCRIMTVSMNDGETPYTVPLCFGYKADDEGIKIYVHTGADGKVTRFFEKKPQVFCVTYILYHDLVKYYRQDYHDYRSFMAKGTVFEVTRKEMSFIHGTAVQAMLKQYKRPRTHFDVPHYMWMRVWCISCKWEDISAKAESPIDRIEDVPFPGPDDPIDDRPPEYERLFCKKFFETEPVCTEPEADVAAEECTGETRIPAEKIRLEAAWDDKDGTHTDLDAYALFLNEEEKMPRRYDLVFHNAPTTFRTEAVRFLGDDICTVKGRESMEFDLSSFGESYSGAAICLSSYEAVSNARFIGDAANIRVTLCNAATGEPILRYRVRSVKADAQAMQIARLKKIDGAWYFIPEEKYYEDWRQPHVFAEYGLAEWRE
ncbi:MAG: TerD family protein [Clostridia bacterium]|nr:TerD family protein [Clostridia bacterium]